MRINIDFMRDDTRLGEKGQNRGMNDGSFGSREMMALGAVKTHPPSGVKTCAAGWKGRSSPL